MTNDVCRIAVFYDGNYFKVVSNYYKYQHSRNARISLSGLHKFIQKQISEKEQVDENRCQIVESHYFKGRFSVKSSIEKGKLEDERKFEDVLVTEGIIQHYLPMFEKEKATEKGIDVWLSLEAYDLAVHKRFDVLALIACDGDYVPLVRKLNGIGTRVMVLGWDFENKTRTSQALLNVSNYPLMMNNIIDDRTNQKNQIVSGLFYS